MRNAIMAAVILVSLCAAAPVAAIPLTMWQETQTLQPSQQPTSDAGLRTGAAPQDSNSAHAESPQRDPEDMSVPDPRVAVPLSDELERRARNLNQKMRCPVCQSSSIEESPAREATEMKIVVRQQLADGRTDDEIIEYFVSKYGDWVLLAPPARGFNIAIYALPVLLLLGGGVFVYMNARKWIRPDSSSA